MPRVECVYEDDRWRFAKLDQLAQRAVVQTLDVFSLIGPWEVTVLGCDDARIAELNAEFRGKPTPTNVLSWPSTERGAKVPGAIPRLPLPDNMAPEDLGDIAIAYETTRREAAEQGKSLTDHTTHLMVHATLHLLGFDHIHDADAALMEGWERRILAKMGVADPYSEETA